MSRCLDPKFGDLLYAYELGMLSDEERDAFEQHLIACEFCSRRAAANLDAVKVIRHDPRIHEYTKSLADKDGSDRTVTAKHPAPGRTWIRWALSVPIAAAVLLFLVLTDWRFDIRPGNEAIAQENRLVVFNFVNLPDSLDHSRLGDIATNLLITDLGESRYVRVVSSDHLLRLATTLGYGKQDTRRAEVVEKIAREAHAAWVLTGEILRVDSGLVVTAQLASASSGDVLATQRVDGAPDEDIFSVVDRLSAEIRSELPWSVPVEHDPPIADITTHSPEAYRHYLDGVEMATRAHPVEAVEQFDLAVEYDSTFAMAYYYLSRYRNSGDIERALEYSRKASRKERYYIESRYNLVRGDTVRAIALLEDLIDEYPFESLAYWTLGDIYRWRGDIRATIRWLEAAIKVDPYDRDAYNSLVYAYEAVGEREQAVLTANRYINIAPDEPNPYDTRGDMLLHSGNFDAALASYLKALEIKPDYYFALLKSGHLYLREQDYSRADSCYRVCATEGDPGMRAVGREFLACVPLLQGQFSATLASLDSAVTADLGDSWPDHAARMLQMEGRVLAVQGRYDEAIRAVVRCDSLGMPVGEEVRLGMYTELVQIRTEAGRYEQAENGLSLIGAQHMTADSSLWNYWYLRATIDFSRKNPLTAFQSLKRIDSQSVAFPVRSLLARVCLENGELSRAIELYQGIRNDIGPDKFRYGIRFVLSQYYLGRAYEASRWTDRAIEQYEYFLSWWGGADTALPEIADARRRIEQLRAGS